jgi:hypothetical protein
MKQAGIGWGEVRESRDPIQAHRSVLDQRKIRIYDLRKHDLGVGTS